MHAPVVRWHNDQFWVLSHQLMDFDDRAAHLSFVNIHQLCNENDATCARTVGVNSSEKSPGPFLVEVCQRLVKLYEIWGKPEQAAQFH